MLSPSEAATTLNADSVWTQFRWFGDSGSLESLDGPYTFTVPSGQVGIFDVTDAFEIGDRFTLTDGSTLLGVTPSATGSSFTRDPDLAFASPLWSSASFELEEGSHSVQLETTTLANGQTLGGGFIRLRFEDAQDLVWDTPAAIVYGNPLSSSQLDAEVIDGRNGAFSYDPPAGTVLQVGSGQVLTATFTPDDGGSLLTVTTTLQVTRAPLTVTVTSVSRPFGQSNPAFTATYDGLVNGDVEADLDALPNFSTTATPTSPPGTYPISANGGFDANYAFSVVPGTLTISNDSNLTVTWAQPEAIVYGTPLTNAVLNASIDEGLPGTYAYTPSIGTVLNAGTHTLNLIFTPDDPTEPAIGGSQTILVERAPLTIRADDQVGSLTNVPKPLPFVLVGNPGNAPNGNYGAVANSFEIGQFEVTNADYTKFLNAVAKNDPVNNSNFSAHPPLYHPEMGFSARGGIDRSGSAPNFSYQAKAHMANKPIIFTSFLDAARFCNWLHNGRPNGDQVAATTEDGAYDLTDPTAVLNNSVSRKPGARFFLPNEDEWFKAAFHNPNVAGEYHTYPTGSDTLPAPALANAQGNVSNPGSNIANYNRNADWDSNQNGTIETAMQNGSLGVEDGNVTAVGSSGSVSFYGAADMGGNVSEWTDTAISTWGRIERGGSWNGPDGFLPSGYRIGSPISEEIKDRGFRIARPATPFQEWILPNFTVSYFGLVNGDTPSTIGSTPSVTTSATPSSLLGNYALNITGGFTSNYLVTHASGTLRLNGKLNPTLGWNTPGAITYGTPLTNAQLNASVVGVSGTYTYEPPLNTVLPAGPHTLIATFTPNNTATHNPVLKKVSITVNPAPLTIRATAITLTSPNFDLEATYEGLVNGDTKDDLYVPVTLATEGSGDSVPGTYAITASGASSPNYTITFMGGTLTRLEPVLSDLVWANPAAISYGTALSGTQLNATTSNSIDGAFVYSPPLGTLLEPTSATTLQVDFTPTDTFNYQASSATVSLQVLKAPLQVTIADAMRAAGVDNPTPTVSFSGFVLGETAADLDGSLSFTTTATLESAPGTYAITGLGTDSHYDINVTPGTLTIAEKLVPSASWPASAGITYGQALTVSQLNASLAEDIPGEWSYTPSLGSILEAGTQTLTAIFTPSNAFAYESVSASIPLTISPAALTVRARDAERPFGQENPTLGFDYLGFVNGDSSADIDQRPTASTEATAESEPGTYPITLSAAADTNYVITSAPGTLTVLERDLVPLPELVITRAGDNVTLSWETNDGIRLEQADALLEWAPISTGITVTDPFAFWTQPIELAMQQFYRLARIEEED